MGTLNQSNFLSTKTKRGCCETMSFTAPSSFCVCGFSVSRLRPLGYVGLTSLYVAEFILPVCRSLGVGVSLTKGRTGRLKLGGLKGVGGQAGRLKGVGVEGVVNGVGVVVWGVGVV